MKALKRNCKVPFLIGGYFCSETHGGFNSLYFTLVLISRTLRSRLTGHPPHTVARLRSQGACAGEREGGKNRWEKDGRNEMARERERVQKGKDDGGGGDDDDDDDDDDDEGQVREREGGRRRKSPFPRVGPL